MEETELCAPLDYQYLISKLIKRCPTLHELLSCMHLDRNIDFLTSDDFPKLLHRRHDGIVRCMILFLEASVQRWLFFRIFQAFRSGGAISGQSWEFYQRRWTPKFYTSETNFITNREQSRYPDCQRYINKPLSGPDRF